MNTKSMSFHHRSLIATALAFLLSTFNASLSTSFAQGSLTPPGAPAPLFKTLTQIEPRTAITNTGAVTISNAGSYYLTANITVATGDGVTIGTNNVTLDLNGFTIATTSPTVNGFGIRLVGTPRNISIFNGNVGGGVTNNGSGVYSGGGFAYCVAHDFNPPSNVRVTGVSLSGCQNGIFFNTGESTVVESCTVKNTSSRGIVASTVSHSTAYQCGGDAITGLTVSDCYGYATGAGDGIHANAANNCYGTSAGSGDGVFADTATSCRGSSASGAGVNAKIANTCYGLSTSGNGVSATAAKNCYGSSVAGNGVYTESASACYGINVTNATGLVASTLASDCIGVSANNGLYANVANNCYGVGTNNYGLLAAYSVMNCYGMSVNGQGILCVIANNCQGEAWQSIFRGVEADVANNCFGYSKNGIGLWAKSIAIGCYGVTDSGEGLNADIANSCKGTVNNNGTAQSINHKYNMP